MKKKKNLIVTGPMTDANYNIYSGCNDVYVEVGAMLDMLIDNG